MMNENDIYIENLKRYMTQHNMTCKQLSELTKVDLATLSRVLNKKRRVPITVLHKISRALGKEISYTKLEVIDK